MQRLSHIERKSDTRKKIMLGGLIVKAGLDYLHPINAAVLYGMLLDCKERLHENQNLANFWKHKGKELLVVQDKSRM